ncbi:MAG: pyridoxal phosphate-dependent aminotransferase [Synergistaceae bacterium]|jgi:cystathionine beta-lyase|nr:pyridoxal phosphate-dependent aminotransferase [Synergistaceae bacterium]
MYEFDRLLMRKGTDCSKWDALRQTYGDPDLVPLWVADMDFPVLPELEKALAARTENSTFGYTFAGEGYYRSVIDWNAKRNDLSLTKEDILDVPGVVCGLSFIIAALTRPEDKVLITPPVYPHFFGVPKSQGRQLLLSPLRRGNERYEIDFEDFEAKLKEGAKAFIFCSPHNPVGRVWERGELENIVELCARYGTIILSDEIHSDLVFPGHKHIPILNVSPEARDISVTAFAPSKTFNIAGLKSSMLIVKNPELRGRIRALLDQFHVGVNLFGYKAAEIVYREGEKWLEELLVYLEGNAQFVVSFLKSRLPRVGAYLPESTYLMWLDFSGYGLTQEALMEKMRDKARVALNSGVTFGEEGKGHVRLNIGTTRALLQEGLEKIAAAFGE